MSRWLYFSDQELDDLLYYFDVTRDEGFRINLKLYKELSTEIDARITGATNEAPPNNFGEQIIANSGLPRNLADKINSELLPSPFDESEWTR